MKKLLQSAKYAHQAIVGGIVVAIGAALVKLRGHLLRGSVPAWLFAIFCVIASVEGYIVLHLLQSKKKRRLHFVPDVTNRHWVECGPQDDQQMDVTVGGTLTFEGESPVTLLDGYLEGTRSTRSMYVKI